MGEEEDDEDDEEEGEAHELREVDRHPASDWDNSRPRVFGQS